MSDEGRMDSDPCMATVFGIGDCGCQPSARAGNSETSKRKVDMIDFTADMWDVIDHCGNVLISKQEDYGPLNISRAPGGPLNGLRVRMFDKISRINNLIDEGKTPENESLRDSFLDLANYSIIALMVLDGTWPELED